MSECEVLGCENIVPNDQHICSECESKGVIGVEYFQDTVNQYIVEGHSREEALALAANDAIEVIDTNE